MMSNENEKKSGSFTIGIRQQSGLLSDASTGAHTKSGYEYTSIPSSNSTQFSGLLIKETERLPTFGPCI